MLEPLYYRKTGTGAAQNIILTVPKNEQWKIYAIYFRAITGGSSLPLFNAIRYTVTPTVKEIDRIVAVTFDDSIDTDIDITFPSYDLLSGAPFPRYTNFLDVGLKDYPFIMGNNQRLTLTGTAGIGDTWDVCVLVEKFNN